MQESTVPARMSAALLAVALVVGLLVPQTATAQAKTPEEIAEMTSIRPVAGKKGLYVIPGFDGGVTGGNVAVRVTDDGVILVDNKFPYSYATITAEVRKITSLPIRYVLDTHHHDDHSGSNADFMTLGEVISHINARANIVRNNQPGAPRLVFKEETSIFLGGTEARAYHFGRGHTNGDAVIYFPELKTIHTGDLFIWGKRSDGSKLSPFMDYRNGGSGMAWPATLDGILSLDFDTAIPGHGPVLTRAEVETFRDRMSELNERMEAAVTAGVGRDQIVDRLDISDLDWPFRPAAIQAFYDEVAASR